VVELDGDSGLEEQIQPQIADDQEQHPTTPVGVDGDRASSSLPQPRAQTHRVIGDLEPPLEVLNLLVSKDAIQDDMRLILDKDPLQSLFSFEWGRGKPLPPPPLPKPKGSKGKFAKVKRDRKAENEKRKRQREEAIATQQDQVKGEGEDGTQVNVRFDALLGGPRTRRAVAAAEAHAEMLPPEDVAAADAVSKRGSSAIKRRMSAVHGEDPPMVEDVGSQESFKMFHEGWVLPEGHRRRGRPAPVVVETQVAPRPKKKAKTGAGM
jgi:NuA3 HAT complex component NTO1